MPTVFLWYFTEWVGLTNCRAKIRMADTIAKVYAGNSHECELKNYAKFYENVDQKPDFCRLTMCSQMMEENEVQVNNCENS